MKLMAGRLVSNITYPKGNEEITIFANTKVLIDLDKMVALVEYRFNQYDLIDVSEDEFINDFVN